MPRKRAGRDRRRENLAALDDEDIVGRAFRHVARIVQHQRFVRAGEVRFDPRHDVVQIIERLHRGIQRGRIRAARRAGHNRQTAFDKLLPDRARSSWR